MSQQGRITIWFTSRERAAIEQEAKRLNTSVSWVVRNAVHRHLQVATPVTRNNEAAHTH